MGVRRILQQGPTGYYSEAPPIQTQTVAMGESKDDGGLQKTTRPLQKSCTDEGEPEAGGNLNAEVSTLAASQTDEENHLPHWLPIAEGHVMATSDIR